MGKFSIKKLLSAHYSLDNLFVIKVVKILYINKRSLFNIVDIEEPICYALATTRETDELLIKFKLITSKEIFVPNFDNYCNPKLFFNKNDIVAIEPRRLVSFLQADYPKNLDVITLKKLEKILDCNIRANPKFKIDTQQIMNL